MTIAKKRPPRRIASDEAHAWARNLRLQNTNAKFLLMVLAGYVDGDGVCFVSTTALAEDTELSQQTIRSRLAWLEEIGVIARTAQWIDEHGHRNGKGAGRRTSDNIRLMIDLDPDAIEQRASGLDGPTSAGENTSVSEVDPQNVTLSAAEDRTVAPPAAPMPDPPVDPQHTAEGLISEPEPEPESPPKGPPPGDLDEDENDQVQEVEHFSEFWQAYPGHEVMSRWRALEIFVTMKPDERKHARAAAVVHAETLKKMKRRPRDAHKWLAEKGWQEYPQAKIAPVHAAAARRLIRGDELAGVLVALKIAGRKPPGLIDTASEETGKRSESTFWGREVGLDLTALARFARQDPADWQQVILGQREFAAWRERLQGWLGFEIEGERVWLEPKEPEHDLPGSHPDFKIRKSTIGLYVPTPWPPSTEGKIYTPEATPPPHTALGELSDQDAADFR